MSLADMGSAPTDASCGKKNSEVTKKPESGAQTPRRLNRRMELLFQRVKNNNKRYRPLTRKVVCEPKHILTLENGSVLRKSGVAEKVRNPKASELAKKELPKPPTMVDVKRRIERRQISQVKAARKMHGLRRDQGRKIGTRITTLSRIPITSHSELQFILNWER